MRFSSLFFLVNLEKELFLKNKETFRRVINFFKEGI